MNSDVYGILLTAMGILLASAVVVPFAAGKRKLAGWLNFLFVAAAGAMLFNISYITVFGESQLSRLIHIGPLDLYFMVDSFSGFFIFYLC